MNNSVSGKILSATSHVGITDLLVVIYDIDLQQVQTQPINTTELTHRIAVRSLTINTYIPTSDDPATASPVEPTTPLPDNFTIEQALRSNAHAWTDFPGDRIGSVLTDKQGRFKLEYDDKAYQVSTQERRPDLVLLVLGPDHSKGVGIIDRILHYAYIPRENSGRIESYIIHISEEELKAKHVPMPTPPMRANVTDIRRRLRNNRHQRRVQRELFNNSYIWLAPPGLATNPRFVPPKTLASEATIRTAIEGGITNIAAATAKPVVVSLATTEVSSAGITAPTGGSTLSLGSVSICDVLALKGIGTELVRTRNLLTEARARSTSAAIGTDTAPTGPATTPSPASTVDPEFPEFLEDKVYGQIAQLPSIPEMPVKPASSLAEELITLKEHINELELSSGPTNVTAFRDFHALQMAFEDVWTAAFDESLSETVKNLYEDVTALDEDYGMNFPRLESTQNANELIEYLNTVSDGLRELEAELEPVPEFMQSVYPQLTQSQWNRLSEARQDTFWNQTFNVTIQSGSLSAEEMQEQLDTLYRYHIRDLGMHDSPLSRIENYITDINDKLSKPYSFKYFAPNTVNYGILNTYRQEWRPQNYQVGRMVSTIPLAPGESREFKIRRRVKQSRAEKEMRKALVENSYESSSTVRTELDVIAKLSTDSNFKLSAQGTFNLGIGSISSTSEFSHNQKNESSRQQKQFAEATRKASEKVRQEREVTIESKDEFEASSETTQNIHNPNDEVTVTYLLYELERRYNVTHRLHKVTPTIMVALEMPSPHELTEGWILEHAWILRRVLLDDSFEKAIAYIEKGRASETVDIEVKHSIYEKEKDALTTAENDLDAVLADRRQMRETVIGLTRQKAEHNAGEESDAERVGDFFLTGGFSELFRDRGPDEGELIQAQIDAAESRLKYVEQATEEMGARLRAIRRSAKEAAENYTNAIKKQVHADTLIQQFQMHLRQNIFHYMHSIWEAKHPDELFFSLVDIEVPFVETATTSCSIREATTDEIALEVPGIVRDGIPYVIECGTPTAPDPSAPLPTKRLGSIAHVDQLLGFKGNYAIFPLKVCSHITNFMMQEFIDDYMGIRDPANDSGFTTPELLEYSAEVWSDLTPAEQSALNSLVVNQLSKPNSDTETVILPTGQLYMEALKGEQALLEDFKLAHRGMDVLKVQEEIRESRLENLRRAGRLLGEERDFGDPDIDKIVQITGTDVSITEDS